MEVQIDDVQVERDGRRVLTLPSLRVRGERTTAILGPNGAGKTTLLRLIAGLEHAGTGKVLFCGSPAQPRVAYVFQEEVFLRQSVRANLELGLRLRGVGPADRRARVEQAAGRLGIVELLNRRADHLSAGEARRVSIARALCLQAPLVLLDEPLAGLDERTYSRLLDELPRLLAAFDATTLFVTHNRNEALRLAQDLVVLVDGRVGASGDIRAVVTDPRSAAVAEVLGYALISLDGRRVAVPPGALRAGPGGIEFPALVEEVLDLIDRFDVVVRIGEARIRAAWPAPCGPPRCGDRVAMHATRVCELTAP